MQTLNIDRFDELCGVFEHLEVPVGHPDPAAFAYDELRKAGFSDEELSEVDLGVGPSGEPTLHAVGHDLLCEKIVQASRWSPRRWRKVLAEMDSVATTIAEANGGMPDFAKSLDDADFRDQILESFGMIVEGILMRMPLRRVTKPEQAVLCVLSSNETHNQLARPRDVIGPRPGQRMRDLLERRPALFLLFLMKKAKRGDTIQIFTVYPVARGAHADPRLADRRYA